MRHLSAAANAWDAMGRPDSELYRGARLSATAQWRESARPVLAAVEAAFLDASIEREAADLAATRRQLQRERRSVRRLRWLAGATASLAVLALTAGTVAAVQIGAANEQAVVEDARRVAALAGAEPAYERALLLAVEAIRLWDAPTTRRTLLDVMGRSPRIVSVTRTSGDVGVQQMSLAPDGSTAVVVDDDLGARVIDLDRHAQIGEYVSRARTRRGDRPRRRRSAGRPDRTQRARGSVPARWIVRRPRPPCAGPRRPWSWRDHLHRVRRRTSSTSSSHRTGRSQRSSHRCPTSTKPGISRSGEWRLPMSRCCSTSRTRGRTREPRTGRTHSDE